MKKIYFPLVFIILFVINGQGQSKHSFFLYTGYTYNDYVEINGEEVKNSEGYLLNFGLNYRVLDFNFFSTEIGFAGKTIFSFGKIGNDRFSANTLRLAMPIKFITPVSKNWSAVTGFMFQNNVDASEFDIRLRDKYSWRVDFTIEARYSINEKWFLSGGFAINLRDTPDAYFINDPKASFMIGLARHTFIFKNKKNKR